MTSFYFPFFSCSDLFNIYLIYKFQYIPPHINNLEIFVKSRRCHLFPYRNMGHAAGCTFLLFLVQYLFGYYTMTSLSLLVKRFRYFTTLENIKCIVIRHKKHDFVILAICKFDDAKISEIFHVHVKVKLHGIPSFMYDGVPKVIKTLNIFTLKRLVE